MLLHSYTERFNIHSLQTYSTYIHNRHLLCGFATYFSDCLIHKNFEFCSSFLGNTSTLWQNCEDGSSENETSHEEAFDVFAGALSVDSFGNILIFYKTCSRWHFHGERELIKLTICRLIIHTFSTARNYQEELHLQRSSLQRS